MVQGDRVEFQTDTCSSGEGVVVAVNEATEEVIIIDDDGLPWHGLMDYVKVINKI